MIKQATCLPMNPDSLWAIAPIIFSKEYAKEVGEPPIFDFNNKILIFIVSVGGKIASFCIDEDDGETHNWRYDYTLPEYRGIGMNNVCFNSRDVHCKYESCYIEVRQEREARLKSIGFKTEKSRGQWRFMRRE